MNSSVTAIWISGLIFALTHSLMASRPCKRWFEQFGMEPHQYRMGYSFLSLLLCAIWLWLLLHLPDRPLYEVSGSWQWLLRGMQLTGLMVAVLSLRHVDGLAFLGLKPFPDYIEPFREEGIYRHIRHPMYSGAMLILLAAPVQSLNSMNLALAVSLYLVGGSIFEEQRMLQDNPQYADYRRRVPAFIPWRALFSFIRRS